MLKNISNIEQVIKCDGKQYPVEPGQVFDVKSMAPLGKISDLDAICLEEKWTQETGGKLARITPEALKAENKATISQEAEKPQPAKDQVAKPATEKAKSDKKRGKK